MSALRAARIPARLRRARVDVAMGFDEAASVAEQLAVLLAAGVPGPAAWRHLDTDGFGDDGLGDGRFGDDRFGDDRFGGAASPAQGAADGSGRAQPASSAVRSRVVAAAARAAAGGDPIADAIAEALASEPLSAPTPGGHRPRGIRSRSSAPDSGTVAGWHALAAAWAVAGEAGAPLSPSLRELAAGLRDEAQSRRDLEAALAGPRASAVLVGALPLLAIGFGVLLGFDTVGVLLGSPAGLACLIGGSLLLWAGNRWNGALLRRAQPPGTSPGIALDLVAIAMAGGVSLERGRSIAASALERHLPGTAGDDDVERVVRLAAAAGAPVAELLRAEASRHRREARSRGAIRAARLAVHLMIPLGACVLPAFVLLGVAPLMISVVSGTFGGAV